MSNWQFLIDTLTETAGKLNLVPKQSDEKGLCALVKGISSNKLVQDILIRFLQEYNENYRKTTVKDKDLFMKAYVEAFDNIHQSDRQLFYKQLVKAQLLAENKIKNISGLLQSLSIAKTEFPAPVLPNNETFPCASKKIKVECSKEKGRHVICAEAINIGDVLFIEKPEAFIVNHEFNLKFCHCCCKRVQSIVPCQFCNEVLYCSEKCRDTMIPVHCYECGYLAFLQSLGVAHLALRCLLAKPVGDDAAQLRRYNDIMNLQYHVNCLEGEELFQYAVTAVLLTTFLKRCTDYFTKNPKASPDSVSVLLLRHILQLIVNAHAVVYNCAQTLEPGTSVCSTVTSPRVATGIYPSSAMMNHSCEPNIVNNFHGNILVVRASKNIEPGEEIFNCYGPHYVRMPREERLTVLWDQYNFKCSCGPCTMPFDPMDSYTAFKCSLCCGALVTHNNSTGVCRSCGVESPVTDAMLEGLKKSNAVLKNALANDKLSMLALIGAWKTSRKVLYHSHDTTYRLADEMARRLAMSGRWKQCLTVLKPSLLVLRRRYGDVHPVVVSEIQKISRAAAATARQEENSILARKYLEESQMFEEESKDLSMLIYGCPEILDDIDL